jgi:HD-GYP domain-containing protein (c-di-GMP phosphodiesterase class II)
MSSDRLSDAPSQPPEELAALVRSRGEPLLEALDRHLPGAREDGEATASYVFVAAAELGFARDRCELYREVTKLHQIGLVYVPAVIATRPPAGRDATETAAFEGHFESGYSLARGAGIPEQVCLWLLRQRERYDGSGPEGLGGDRIPLESRLIRGAAVCQSALAVDRTGDERSLIERASATLTEASGSELDPRVVTALTGPLARARKP